MPIHFRRQRIAACSAAALAFVLAASPGTAANLLRLDQQLIAPDSEPGDLFGKTVDLDGEFAMVRSREDYGNIGVPDRGPQTHVFRRSHDGSWSQSGVTVHALESDFWSIGRSAALDGGVIVNGQVTGTRVGSQYSALKDVTFTNAAAAPSGVSTAVVADPFLLHPRNPDNPFPLGRISRTVGRSVAISGDIAVANDSSYEQGGGSWGSLHFYERSASGVWEWSARVTSKTTPTTPPAESVSFGLDVALSGHTAMVHSRSTDQSRKTEGHVSFFEREGPGQWNETSVVRIPGNFPAGQGYLVGALDGDTAVITALSQSSPVWGQIAGNRAGVTAILSRMTDNRWEYVQEIGPGYPYRSVAIEGDLIALSSFDSLASDVSQVLLYQRNDAGLWDLKQALTSPDPFYDSTFGSSLALDDGRLLVGAVATGDLVPGAAFLYLPVPEPAAAAFVLWAIGAQSNRRSRNSTSESAWAL